MLKQKIEGELRTINWASKKFTQPESRWGITDKEFFAVVWGIEHFAYYLRGNKFKVITDHKAIEYFRDKKALGTLRLERMRDRLEEYNMDIEYRQGSLMIEADALSRMYEGREHEREERKELIRQGHREDEAHIGLQPLVKKMEKEYIWTDMNKLAKEVIDTCEVCRSNRQKTNGGEIFVSTERPLEKIGMDLVFIGQDTPILTMKDYYTRKIWMWPLKNKTQEEIAESINKFLEVEEKPEMIITDCGKEFDNNTVKELLNSIGVLHHMTSPENHRANGRIERLHRDLNNYVRKRTTESDNIDVEIVTREFVRSHNASWTRSIGMAPDEAWDNPFDPNLQEINSPESKYAKEFKKKKREVFKVGEQIRLRRSEVELKDKLGPRYDAIGTIKEVLDNDAYLVQEEITGKIKKRGQKFLAKFYPRDEHIDREGERDSHKAGDNNEQHSDSS